VNVPEFPELIHVPEIMTLADINPHFPSFKNGSTGSCTNNATGGGTWVEANPFVGPLPFRIDPIQRPIYVEPVTSN
jgi:hypothetical protein